MEMKPEIKEKLDYEINHLIDTLETIYPEGILIRNVQYEIPDIFRDLRVYCEEYMHDMSDIISTAISDIMIHVDKVRVDFESKNECTQKRRVEEGIEEVIKNGEKKLTLNSVKHGHPSGSRLDRAAPRYERMYGIENYAYYVSQKMGYDFPYDTQSKGRNRNFFYFLHFKTDDICKFGVTG
jgi:hypothetical protein